MINQLLGWALALTGQLLIALGFFYFFDVAGLAGLDVCCLDFFVVSVVYWVWLVSLFRTPVNPADKSGSQAAGLGLGIAAISFYSIAALVAVALGLIYAGTGSFPFKWQLLIQLLLLFLLGMGLLLSRKTSEHVGEIYAQEEGARAGKVNLRMELQYLAGLSETSAGVPADVKARIRNLANEVRYITPSTSPEARMADDKIVADIRSLSYALANYAMNRERIAALLDSLGRHFSRRKAAF